MKHVIYLHFRQLCLLSGALFLSACDSAQQVQISQLDNYGRFGRDIDISAANAIVGAYQESHGSAEGAAYVFTRQTNTWSIQARLESPTPADEEFGSAVAIFNNFAAVSAPMDHQPGAFRSGSVHVYQRTNIDDWNHFQTLNSPFPHQAWELFGSSLAMDNTLLAVAAIDRDEPGATDAGVVFVYEYAGGAYNYIDMLTVPSPAANDAFGAEVAIMGDTIAVSAIRQDLRAGEDAGAVYVFERSRGGFSLSQTLTANDADEDMLFGTGLALFAPDDGTRRIVVGASGAGIGGAAYVFDAPSGGAFSQSHVLTASDAQANDNFGTEVALWNNTVLVGATGADEAAIGSGAAYTFFYDGITWMEESKLTVADANLHDQLGLALDLWGENALVGATEVDLDDSLTSTGAAYAFQRQSSGSWAYEHMIHAQGSNGLTFAEGGENTRFGSRFALDNAQLFVRHARGADMFNEETDGFSLEQVFNVDLFDIRPYSVAVDGDTAAVFSKRYNPALPVGLIDIYVKPAGSDTWNIQQQLEPDLIETAFPLESADSTELTLQGNTLVAGAPRWSVTEGRVFIYERSSGVWGAPQIIQAPESHNEFAYGRRVALDGDWLAVSQVPTGGSPAFQRHGRVHIYQRAGNGFTYQQELTAPAFANLDLYGQQMDLDGSLIATSGGNPSTIRVYERNGGSYSEIWSEAGTALDLELHGDFLAIGRDDQVQVYQRQPDDSFAQVEVYTASDEAANTSFGDHIAIDDDHVMVGANTASNPAKVYIFDR